MAYNYDEDITDGEPLSNATSTRRYQTKDTPMLIGDAAYSTTRSRVPARRTMAVEHEQTTRRMPPADVEWQPEPGLRYAARDARDHVVLPRMQGQAQRHSQTRQRDTTQPRVQRVQPQTTVQKVPLISHQLARIMIAAGVGIGALVIPFAATIPVSEGIHIVRQYQEGVNASVSISGVFEHNHDSKLHPTILRATVAGNYIDFEELPAGDETKLHGFQTPSLATMGYTGDKTEIYLEIIPEQDEYGKQEIRLNVTMGGVGMWPSAWYVSSSFVFQDNGNYFVPVTSK